MTPSGKASFILSVAVLVLSMAPAAATADVVTFFVHGTFDDGGTFTGSFRLDRTNGTIPSFGIGSTGGSVFKGFVYDASRATGAANLFVNPGCGVIQLSFVMFNQSNLIIAVPGVSPATFEGGAITPRCPTSLTPNSFEQPLPAASMLRTVTGGQAIAVGVDAGVGVAASVNQLAFAVGQMLKTSARIDDPGVAGSADLYLGVLLSDGVTIVFWTGGSSLAVGSLTDVRTFRAHATGVPLAMPFVTDMPDFFAYQWTGSEPRGSYVFFNLVTRAGALAGGSATRPDLLGLATAAFSFP